MHKIMQYEYFGAVKPVTTQLDLQLINIRASEAHKPTNEVLLSFVYPIASSIVSTFILYLFCQ